MIPRTPRKRGHCMDCEEENSIDDMVQCDSCKKWSHFQCAGVDSSVAERNWKCKQCTQSKAVGSEDVYEAELNLVPASIRTSQNAEHSRDMAQPQQDLFTPGEHLVSYMELRNIGLGPINGDRVPTRPPSSLSSASSGRSKVQLELQCLEEQHDLEQRHAKEREDRERAYVQKKYELLSMEECADVPQGPTKKTVSESKVPIVNSQIYVKSRCASASNVPKGVENATKPYYSLTPEQLSSRQVLSKELPIFTGRPEEWPIFLSCFENSTKLCGFSDSENLSRLQRALRGDALAAVSSRLLIPALVPEVISSLRMLFGRPAIIVKSLIDKIKSEPPPRADKLDSLISYALSVRSLQATMEAAKLTNHLNNPILLQELIERLPASLKLNWAMESMKLGSDERNLTEFSDWLYGVAEAASTVTTLKPDTKADRRHANVHTDEDVSIPLQTDVTSRVARVCYCCQQDHKLVDCIEFREMHLSRKWELVRQFSVCECCLKHPKRFRCKDVRECAVNGCRAKHHRLLYNPERTVENDALRLCNAHQGAQEEKSFSG